MKRFSLKNAIVAVSISAVLLTGTSFGAARTPRHPRQLSFAERVAYQYAIEEVYWRHRIWPKENPGPKPLLDEVMSAAQIEKKVNDYLRNSQLLANYWQRPITPEQLQAEMERMASKTKQPEVLQELFAALDNDPFFIAECLARPVLSERLLKQLYAHDERIYGELKRRAESELRACENMEQMKRASGTYSEVEWIRSDDDRPTNQGDHGIVGHAHHRLPNQDSAAPKAFGAVLQRDDAPNAIRMTTTEWDESIRKLAAQFSSALTDGARPEPALSNAEGSASLTKDTRAGQDALDHIKTGTLSQLQEDDGRYYATVVMEKGKARLKLATIAWEKEPFESWAAKAEMQLPKAADDRAAHYTLPAMAISSLATRPSGCADDSWIPTFGWYLPDGREYHTAIWTGSEMIIWGGDNFFERNTGGRYNPSTDSWTPTTTANAPTARQSHTAIWTGTEMIVWGGGTDTGTTFNTGGRYNPSTDIWVATSSTNVPSARTAHTAVWTGSEMIIWGGTGTLNNTGGRYNPSTNSWVSTSTANAPAGRAGHRAVWTGSQMIVWGGYGESGLLNTGGRYNPITNNWSATSTSNAPVGRFNPTAVWSGTEMIVWGGDSSGFPIVDLNTGGKYNPSTDAWTPTGTTNAPAARSRHTAVWSGSQMIIWGGSTENNRLNTGGKYDPTTNSWVPTTIVDAPAARYNHTAVWTGNEMIVWGSYGSSLLKIGGRYNPSTDSWVATGSTNTAPREDHTAVWTGTEMIVWGGFNDITGELNTGGRYDLSTDSWVPTTTTNAPSARDSHTAVWTGTEMIVWGGFSDDNSGGRYNPISDSWVATNMANSPAARVYHSAVWTGSEMIIWGGGAGPGSIFNTGGRYNPAANSWVATTTTNAAAARYGHTAVWTGSEMIIWGGYDTGFSNLNTGGRYNPSTDSWVTTAIAPDARAGHTAVWTGSEMIVWGGDNGSSYLNTGGRYNPGTNSWSATTTTNAPAPRELHTAVWTGSEMIVWGGFDEADLLNTGGRYNSTTGNWVTTSTTNAPVARYRHTAIWTGSEMIVWGGDDEDDYVNSGGRYCAQSAAPIAQSAVSRKNHGLSGVFAIALPLSDTPGIECRTGGATNDYSIVVTFGSAVTVNGSPQAQVTSGTATVGSGGVSNGGMVTISGNSVTVPLTNVSNAQTINVRLNGVTGSSGSGNVTVPMSILVGDTNANAAVNSGDVAQTKARLGQTLDATNFRSDVNANGAINAGDVSQIKALLGTGLP